MHDHRYSYVSISFHPTLKLTLTPTLTLTLGLTLVAPLTKIPEESGYITALFTHPIHSKGTGYHLRVTSFKILYKQAKLIERFL